MRFNTKRRDERKIRNKEGAEAWKMKPEMELYSAVVASSLDKAFYESQTDRIKRIRELISKCDARFVAKLAVHARENINMRTLPLVLAVELAKVHNGDDLIRRMSGRIIKRADEITELLAYYQMANTRKENKKLNRLSKQLQLGLADAFNRFDEYQFAKYNRNTEVRLRDALFLVHPKPVNEAQQQLFDKIASDSLAPAYTWESELSQAGQGKFASQKEKEAAKRDKWEEMIFSGRMGYMAMLRNLRNFLQSKISAKALDRVAQILSNERKVARSKQLPFRFLSAYREIAKVANGEASMLLEALEQAVQASAKNIAGFDRNTRVLIANDMSGSMQTPLSAHSTVMYYEVGLILAMLLQSRCKNVVTGLFGSRWKIINLPRNQILSNAAGLSKRVGEVGHATDAHLVISDLIRRRVVMDKVMIFTDLQLWNSGPWVNSDAIQEAWRKYKKRIAPGAKLYLFDLAGYGQMPLDVRENDVFLIAGWSDKIFGLMEAIEQGSNVLAEIEKIEI